MNKKQLIIDVCRAMLDSDKRLYGCFLNPREFAVTTTGTYMYIFSSNDCIFDVHKIQRAEQLIEVCNDVDNDELLQKTNKFYEYKGHTIEEYKGETFTLYADRKIASTFKGFKMWANSETSRVLVTDSFGKKVGCFLPVKITEKELLHG